MASSINTSPSQTSSDLSSPPLSPSVRGSDSPRSVSGGRTNDSGSELSNARTKHRKRKHDASQSGDEQSEDAGESDPKKAWNVKKKDLKIDGTINKVQAHGPEPSQKPNGDSKKKDRTRVGDAAFSTQHASAYIHVP